MNRLKSVFTLVTAAILLSSCGSKKNQESSGSETFSLEDYIRAAEAIEPELTQVDQIFDILYMVDAEYYDILTNDPYSAHSYKGSFAVAAANMGIYVADIVYHLYGESDESMYLTLSAAQELARFVGVESEFTSWTFENLEGTMMKRDTITRLFNQLLEESEKYNTDQERIFVHTAFLTGSFIEKVYISSNLLKQKLNDEQVTGEEEGNIRKLLVIYLNQLNPSISILYDAFLQQQDQLEGLVDLPSLENLKELALHLSQMKTSLAVAPVSELMSNEELARTFELVAELRTTLVTSSS